MGEQVSESHSGGSIDPFAGTWERNPVRSLGNSLRTIIYEVFEADKLHFRGNSAEYRASPDGMELKAAIDSFLIAWNQDPQPFVWTATAQPITEKLAR